MSKEILLLSGPNLNLLGERQPEIYGTQTLADFVGTARQSAKDGGYVLKDLQTNSEAEMLDAIHQARGQVAGLIINPGAFTHYSWAVADALAAVEEPVIELHISNPEAREKWRRTSVISPVAVGTISGFGGLGYRLAVQALIGICAQTQDR